jgi:transposase-like protein
MGKLQGYNKKQFGIYLKEKNNTTNKIEKNKQKEM